MDESVQATEKQLSLRLNRFVYFLLDLIVPNPFGWMNVLLWVKLRQQQQQHQSLAGDGEKVFPHWSASQMRSTKAVSCLHLHLPPAMKPVGWLFIKFRRVVSDSEPGALICFYSVL